MYRVQLLRLTSFRHRRRRPEPTVQPRFHRAPWRCADLWSFTLLSQSTISDIRGWIRVHRCNELLLCV